MSLKIMAFKPMQNKWKTKKWNKTENAETHM